MAIFQILWTSFAQTASFEQSMKRAEAASLRSAARCRPLAPWWRWRSGSMVKGLIDAGAEMERRLGTRRRDGAKVHRLAFAFTASQSGVGTEELTKRHDAHETRRCLRRGTGAKKPTEALAALVSHSMT